MGAPFLLSSPYASHMSPQLLFLHAFSRVGILIPVCCEKQVRFVHGPLSSFWGA
jgi:hypothetical protein